MTHDLVYVLFFLHPQDEGGIGMPPSSSGCKNVIHDILASCLPLHGSLGGQEGSRLGCRATRGSVPHNYKSGKDCGQLCGDIERVDFLADVVGPVILVLDLRISHERLGISSNPALNRKLHYPNPADISHYMMLMLKKYVLSIIIVPLILFLLCLPLLPPLAASTEPYVSTLTSMVLL